MLRLIFGVGRDGLSFSTVEALLKAGQPDAMLESEYLDFKTVLPVSMGKDKKQGIASFAKSISAFANAGGGVLLCGVREENERAEELILVEFGNSITDLQRSLNQHLSPAPSFSCIPVEKGNGKGLLAIEVLPSVIGPHSVYADAKTGKLGFFVRRGRENVPMREQEIERAYRQRFAVQADTESNFVRARSDAQAATPRGGLWIAATPSGTTRRIYDGPREGKQRFEELAYANGAFRGPLRNRLGGSTVTTRARRVVCFEHSEGSDNLCYLTDEGLFVATFHLPDVEKLGDSAAWVNSLEPVPDAYLARGILGTHLVLLLAALRDVWAHFGLWEQSTVQIGVHPGLGSRLAWISSPSEDAYGTLDEPVIGEWELSLSDLLAPGYLENLLQDAFDEVSGGFGLVIPPIVRDGTVLLKRIKAESDEGWFRARGIRALEE